MFFALSKVFGFFALPSNLIISLGILGALMLATRWARMGWRLVIASLLLLAVFGFLPVGNVLMLTLEQRFPPWDASRGAPDGIIVLGGVVNPAVSAARGVAALNEAAERVTTLVELAQRYPKTRLLFVGGSGGLVAADVAEADEAVKAIERLGIARARLEIENRSRNTDENARFGKQVAAPKPGERWLLITSAHHMPRAVGCFRRAGFAVEAYPVDWRTRGDVDVTQTFGQLSEGLQRADAAAKEYAGLVVYWLTGRTSELWPGPK